MHISTRALKAEDIAACDAINRTLPDWFGIEEGLAEALGYLQQHPGIVAESDGEVVGFLTHTQHFPESAEISWMAVQQANHRGGIGKALITALVQALPPSTRLLTVKTLADTHPSPEYAQTRAFYAACGFLPTMVLPDLWNESNPCLVMTKPVGA